MGGVIVAAELKHLFGCFEIEYTAFTLGIFKCRVVFVGGFFRGNGRIDDLGSVKLKSFSPLALGCGSDLKAFLDSKIDHFLARALAADDGDRNFLAYQRKDREGNTIVVMINFSGSDYINYRLGLPIGKYRVIYNTDSPRYGGTGASKKLVYTTNKTPSHGKEQSICFDLPKLTCVYLKKIN